MVSRQDGTRPYQLDNLILDYLVQQRYIRYIEPDILVTKMLSGPRRQVSVKRIQNITNPGDHFGRGGISGRSRRIVILVLLILLSTKYTKCLRVT